MVTGISGDVIDGKPEEKGSNSQAGKQLDGKLTVRQLILVII